MSDSDGSDDVPPREVCEDRCQNFAAVTGTDCALAMFYLQDRAWDLQRALNAFYEEQGLDGAEGIGASVDNTRDDDSPASSGSNAESSQSKSSTSRGASATMTLADMAKIEDSTDPNDPEPHRIRILSWNIDGLDQNNIKNRTKGACHAILEENPDIVFLQEVVPETLDLIESLCPHYHLIPGSEGDEFEGYFTAMMLRVASTIVRSHHTTPFFSSLMGRNLLQAEVAVKGVPMTLITSHLESTKDHSKERKHQLQAALRAVESAPDASTVVFGGDLNLRDSELAEIGGLPEGVMDLWEITGKRPEAKFTWDLKRNDNLEWNKQFKPQCRFDRLYLRHSKLVNRLKPVYFELTGLKRLESCRRFASDHWGILAHFDKV